MAGKGLSARPLPPGEIEAYDRLANKCGGIFDSVKWTGLLGPTVRRFGIYDGGDNLRGGFCLSERRRFGLMVLQNPPETPSIGPFFDQRATNPAEKTNEQRAVIDAMAQCLSGSRAAVISLGLSPETLDCLPFYWRAFKIVPHYTYRIDLRQNENDIWAAMSVNRRNDIRKAQKDGIEAEEVSETIELRSLILGTFARQDMSFPPETMDSILLAYPPGNGAFSFISRDHGRAAAGAYIVHDLSVAYYLMGGYGEGAHHGAGALAVYHAIRKAKALGLEVFDFEGSMIPPIEKYLREFGGKLTPIFRVHKAWLPLEIALKFYRRQWF